MGLPPQLEPLAVVIRKSGHNKMSKQCDHMQKVYEHTQFHSGMGTQTHCEVLFFL